MSNVNHSTHAVGRVLVTGASGFIGGNLVRSLQSLDLPVRVLLRAPERSPDLSGVEVFRGDLLVPDSLAGVESDVDSVIHCASILGKWGSDPAELHAVNVQGSLNLLERFATNPPRNYIHLSAGGVTGPVGSTAVDESYPCQPVTAYEKTKFLAEQLLLERSRGMNVPATVVRPTFTYGPGDPHKIALFRAIQRGRYVFIGGGISVNHPVYIDDLIRGILLALERARPGEVYIIGGARPVTKRELVFAIADELGVARPRLNLPRWIASLGAFGLETLGRLLGFEPILTRSRVMMMADNFGYSIEKARRELGYEPRMQLEDGICATVAAYREAQLL